MRLLVFVIYSSNDVNCYDNVLYASLFHDTDTQVFLVPRNDDTLALIRTECRQYSHLDDHYVMVIKDNFVTTLTMESIRRIVEALRTSDKRILLLSNEGDYSSEGDVCRISQVFVNSFTKIYSCEGRVRAWDRCFICKSNLVIGDVISGFAFAWPSPFVRHLPQTQPTFIQTYHSRIILILVLTCLALFCIIRILRR